MYVCICVCVYVCMCVCVCVNCERCACACACVCMCINVCTISSLVGTQRGATQQGQHESKAAHPQQPGRVLAGLPDRAWSLPRLLLSLSRHHLFIPCPPSVLCACGAASWSLWSRPALWQHSPLVTHKRAVGCLSPPSFFFSFCLPSQPSTTQPSTTQPSSLGSSKERSNSVLPLSSTERRLKPLTSAKAMACECWMRSDQHRSLPVDDMQPRGRLGDELALPLALPPLPHCW